MSTSREEIDFTYTFENLFHPFVGELIEKLNKDSLAGMLDPGFQKNLSPAVGKPAANSFFTYFTNFYEKPTGEKYVTVKGFPKEIDLREGSAYGTYNWELLFHIPLTIAYTSVKTSASPRPSAGSITSSIRPAMTPPCQLRSASGNF